MARLPDMTADDDIAARIRARRGGELRPLDTMLLHSDPGSAQVGYAAAKAGIIQTSRVIAVQHAPDRIRVNTVVPGQRHIPMVEARLAGQRAGGDVEALLAQRQSRIPIGFMGDGRDTAYAALYLASDEARFVTGTEIVVDGGMTARCD
jgi:NAD(P)-dependent dehydrogenase (short-subunit alcohol dehydrogenase family)